MKIYSIEHWANGEMIRYTVASEEDLDRQKEMMRIFLDTYWGELKVIEWQHEYKRKTVIETITETR